MESELKKYNRNIPGEDLLMDLRRVADELGKETITCVEYDERGKYASNTITRRFGGWNKSLEIVGLKVKFHHNTDSREFVNDLKRVAEVIGRENITRREYNKHGKYGSNTVAERFGSWNKAQAAAGLTIRYFQDISIEALFENLEQVQLKLGKLPGRRAMKLPLSKYSERAYITNFGSWQKALTQFAARTNSEETKQFTEAKLEQIEPEQNAGIETENATLAQNEPEYQLHQTKSELAEPEQTPVIEIESPTTVQNETEAVFPGDEA